MAGLRERKRVRTEASIIEAAAQLFTEKGFADATVEQIAVKAEVGVGTVYNYFNSKRGLLVALFVNDAERSIRVGEQLLATVGQTDPAVAIAELFWAYMVERVFKRDRKLMRIIGAISVAEPSYLDERIMALARQHLEQVARLLEAFQQRGEIRLDLPLESASFVLFSNFLALMMWYFRDQTKRPEDIHEILKRNVSLVLQSWGPPDGHGDADPRGA